MDNMTLAELEPGQTVRIETVNLPASFSQRLRDLGFVTGACVKCCLRAPSGSPLAFRIFGGVIALRRQDAACISCVQEELEK